MSSLSTVIQARGSPFGVLGVDTYAHRTFTDDETHYLQTVANLLALAIERDRSNHLFEQRVAARTGDIEQRLVAAAQERAVLEERQRLARELHDSVTQALYSVTLHAQAAQRLLAAGHVDLAGDSLGVLQDTAQEALDEMRLLIFELRPPVLAQVGLVAALQSRLHAVEGRANLQTKLIADDVGGLPSAVEEALYRICQEALNNALKHAHAHHITVRLEQAPTGVILEVIDDGVGFDVARARETGGMGVRGIMERAARISGKVTVQSAPGVGTCLRVEIGL